MAEVQEISRDSSVEAPREAFLELEEAVEKMPFPYSVHSLRRAILAGKATGIKPGKVYLISESALADFIAKCLQPVTN